MIGIKVLGDMGGSVEVIIGEDENGQPLRATYQRPPELVHLTVETGPYKMTLTSLAGSVHWIGEVAAERHAKTLEELIHGGKLSRV